MPTAFNTSREREAPIKNKVIVSVFLARLLIPSPIIIPVSDEFNTDYFLSVTDEIDEIYDKMVKNRTEQARQLGYENYVELGYYLSLIHILRRSGSQRQNLQNRRLQ